MILLLSPAAGCALGIVQSPIPTNIGESLESDDQSRIDDFQQRREANLMLAARTQLQQHDPSACRRTLEHILKQAPDHRKAQLLLAAAHLADNELQASERVLDAVLTQWPNDSEALRAKALLLDSGALTEEVDGRSVNAISAETPASAKAASSVREAVSALRRQQPAEAVQILRATIEQHPQHAQSYRTLGVALYRMDDAHGAQGALTQALSLDNEDALTYFLLGCVLERLGNVAAAEESYSQAERIDSVSGR